MFFGFPMPALSLKSTAFGAKRHELQGELSVRCGLPGALSFDGTISFAGINLSSLRARQERAKFLAQRARTKDLDWLGLVEEFAQRVLNAERTGDPAIDLRTMPAPEAAADIDIGGLTLPRRHPRNNIRRRWGRKELHCAVSCWPSWRRLMSRSRYSIGSLPAKITASGLSGCFRKGCPA